MAAANPRQFYIASCLYTARFPQLSLKVLQYIRQHGGIDIVRCCIPNFRVKPNEERIVDLQAREAWKQLTPWGNIASGDTVYSICHNCTNIIDEQVEGVNVLSIWELIDRDPDFVFPDYSGLKVTVQDCWRTRERRGEQDAVRSILKKMNIEFTEAAEHHDKTEFCGSTLYRPQPNKNPHFAPKHYRDGAVGKFLPHTEEEQIAIMQRYCSQFETSTVVCYCHYCLEGLLQGGVYGRHLADLVFV